MPQPSVDAIYAPAPKRPTVSGSRNGSALALSCTAALERGVPVTRRALVTEDRLDGARSLVRAMAGRQGRDEAHPLQRA